MYRLFLLIMAALASLVTGCANTDALLKDLRVKELTLERASLQQADAWLRDKPARQQQGELILFVSTDILDRVLRGAEHTEFPLPNAQSVKVQIERVQTAFRDGFPVVEMNAVAKAPGWLGEIKLDLEVSALLDLDPIFLYAPDTQMRIKVLKVVPRVRYLVFRTDIQNAIDAIVSTEIATYAEHLPQFTVPLEKKVRVDLPSKEHCQGLKLPSKWTMGMCATSPAFIRDLVLNIDQVLTLKNGIYVFGRVSIEAS